MKTRYYFWMLIFMALIPMLKGQSSAIARKKASPNVIYIYADDLGYGEIGCYGQEKIKTINLEKMSKEGTSF